MTFTLSLLLVPYALAVLAFIVVSMFNIYHLIHYGAVSRSSLLFTMIFLAGTGIILLVTYSALSQVNWLEPISVSLPQNNGVNSDFISF